MPMPLAATEASSSLLIELRPTSAAPQAPSSLLKPSFAATSVVASKEGVWPDGLLNFERAWISTRQRGSPRQKRKSSTVACARSTTTFTTPTITTSKRRTPTGTGCQRAQSAPAATAPSIAPDERPRHRRRRHQRGHRHHRWRARCACRRWRWLVPRVGRLRTSNPAPPATTPRRLPATRGAKDAARSFLLLALGTTAARSSSGSLRRASILDRRRMALPR